MYPVILREIYYGCICANIFVKCLTRERKKCMHVGSSVEFGLTHVIDNHQGILTLSLFLILSIAFFFSLFLIFALIVVEIFCQETA